MGKIKMLVVVSLLVSSCLQKKIPIQIITEIQTDETESEIEFGCQVVSSVETYGFAAVYSKPNGDISIANTSDHTKLHQYYVVEKDGEKEISGGCVIDVNASFSYVVGRAYYLQSDGSMSTIADYYNSAVAYVIADLGDGIFKLLLKDPIHYVNN